MKTASKFHNHQSNVNQNYNVVLSHLNWNGYYEKKSSNKFWQGRKKIGLRHCWNPCELLQL